MMTELVHTAVRCLAQMPPKELKALRLDSPGALTIANYSQRQITQLVTLLVHNQAIVFSVNKDKLEQCTARVSQPSVLDELLRRGAPNPLIIRVCGLNHSEIKARRAQLGIPRPASVNPRGYGLQVGVRIQQWAHQSGGASTLSAEDWIAMSRELNINLAIGYQELKQQLD